MTNSTSKMGFIPSTQIKAVITKIHQILLPDPNDERDISLEWARNKIHEQLEELTMINERLEDRRRSISVSFNDSLHTDKRYPFVGDDPMVPDLKDILDEAIEQGDYRTERVAKYAMDLVDMIHALKAEKSQHHREAMDAESLIEDKAS